MTTKNKIAALITVSFFNFFTLLAWGDIRITEIMNRSAHPTGTSNGDWFELTNNGALVLDITGWSWDDSDGVAGTSGFGSITSIDAGKSIIFVQETIGAEAAWINDWGINGVSVVNLGASATAFQDFSVSGDSLNIYNGSNTLVASVTFGSGTSGYSFAWDMSGVSLGVSTIGSDGAFRAAGNGAGGAGVDVGSPGFAVVPEPSSFLLVAAGGAILLMRGVRRKEKEELASPTTK